MSDGMCTCGHPAHEGRRCAARVTSVPGYILSCRCDGAHPARERSPIEVVIPADMRAPAVDLPDDIRELLATIAKYANWNPTSAERRRLGDWLGIPRHMLPRSGT